VEGGSQDGTPREGGQTRTQGLPGGPSYWEVLVLPKTLLWPYCDRQFAPSSSGRRPLVFRQPHLGSGADSPHSSHVESPVTAIRLPHQPASSPGDGREPDPTSRDRQLVRSAALGDGEAWAQLVDRHAQLVWDVARSTLSRPEEAAAVSEVVWMLLAEALPDLDGMPVTAWLRRSATSESHLACLRARPKVTAGDRRRQRRLSG
jgi:hypothetical protein